MRVMTIFGNALLAVVAIAGATVFALPVFNDIDDGQVTAVNGAGSASAAMVYVLLVPMLVSLSPRLWVRVLAVGVSGAVALVTRFWVGLVEGGRMEAAFLLVVGAGLVAAGLLMALRWLAGRRHRQVLALARAHGTIADDIAGQLRRRYAAGGDKGRQDGPLRQATLIEQLVFGLIAEAASAEDPEAYARILVHGLEDLRDSLAGNNRADPNGYGALAIGEYLSRLRADLRRRLPEATPRPVVSNVGDQRSPA